MVSTLLKFKGCLFDLDGTLVDSLPAVNRAWSALAERHSLNCEHVLSIIHGRPASESIQELLAFKGKSVVETEIARIKEQETNDTDGIVPIDGALVFIKTLAELNIPWGIVTSGETPVAMSRIKAGNIPAPEIVITADHITKGKPAPEPYLLGAGKLGIAPEDCIVFEDAPAGVKSGLSAKSKVIGILSSHLTPEMLFNVDTIKSYNQIEIEKTTDNTDFILKITA